MSSRNSPNRGQRVTIPGAVLGLLGTLNVVFGTYGIIRPNEWNAQLADGFGASVPSRASYTISLQLINMGIFTLLAASRRSLHRPALVARAGIHWLTGYFFWGSDTQPETAALVEIGTGALSALALLF